MMNVELIASTKMNIDYDADQLPVLAARVSHNNDGKTGNDPDNDLRLMNFLAENKHLTPFEYQHATFKIKAPLFVIQELLRHRTSSFNQVSARYTKIEKRFYDPGILRKQDSKNHQSSSGRFRYPSIGGFLMRLSFNFSYFIYTALLKLGVAREQARAVLPHGTYSELYMSANLRNWSHFCGLRCAEDAQLEIQHIAEEISKVLGDLYPDSWSALNNNK